MSRDRFELFNACRPMRLVVEDLNEDAWEAGLANRAIVAIMESRLRAANLFTDDGPAADFAYLYGRVTVSGTAFSVVVQFIKYVTDEYGQSGLTETWTSASTGTHGRDPGFVLSSLTEKVDQFLGEYMRVNETACG